jgi:hypothetical protein
MACAGTSLEPTIPSRLPRDVQIQCRLNRRGRIKCAERQLLDRLPLSPIFVHDKSDYLIYFAADSLDPVLFKSYAAPKHHGSATAVSFGLGVWIPGKQ